MAEEFPAGVCGGSWWNPPRAAFNGSSCSSVSSNIGGCWPSDLVEMKAKSSEDSSDGSMIFQDIQKPSGGTTTMSPDSAFQMMGISLSNSSPATSTDWNQSLLMVDGRNEGNYDQLLPEVLNNFPMNGDDDSLGLGFAMDQQQQLDFFTSSGDCTASLVTSTNTFPVSSTSYGYPSNFLQTLFESNSPPLQQQQQQQQSLYDFRTNLNDFNFMSRPKFEHLVKQKQQKLGGLHLANKTPFWDASASALNDNRSSLLSSTEYEEKLINCPKLTSKDSGSLLKKGCGEPAFKRPRLETPSALPTFKVRKEKLGDRVTALQQLVSPFGKTDTASVLHEAIDYIKLLHDQVNVLSTPYMKNGAVMQKQETHDKVKDAEGAKQDLRSRGLCLVPVSSTFPVTTNNTPDFWTPSFGDTCR